MSISSNLLKLSKTSQSAALENAHGQYVDYNDDTYNELEVFQFEDGSFLAFQNCDTYECVDLAGEEE